MKAILWTILPNVRKDALLSKQANMINKFREVDIWSNVIIVCKQSRNPEDDTQGALYAAKTFCPGLAFNSIVNDSRLLKAHVPTSKICLLLLLNLLQIYYRFASATIYDRAECQSR